MLPLTNGRLQDRLQGPRVKFFSDIKPLLSRLWTQKQVLPMVFSLHFFSLMAYREDLTVSVVPHQTCLGPQLFFLTLLVFCFFPSLGLFILPESSFSNEFFQVSKAFSYCYKLARLSESLSISLSILPFLSSNYLIFGAVKHIPTNKKIHCFIIL